MASEEPEKGDQASWQWSGGRPSGEVVEKKTEGELAIQSKKGNTIKKNASADNPALHMARPGNDVVKRQSEVEVVEKAAGSGAADEEPNNDENGTEAQPGDKRARDDADEPAPEGSTDAKKAKTAGTPGRSRGRPKKTDDKPKATPAKKPTIAEKKSAAAAEKKEAAAAAAAEKKDAKTVAEKKEAAAAAAVEPKKARGRPKKSEGEKKAPVGPTKVKKVKKPVTTEGVGSRTRSKK
ncbi:MAG: hypothetical protein FRX48_05923 [Lasallia pustulata]|uniref:Hypervirulence associated protein TUDOR domain-containing protein n=1 Tax=Lasallia pustulata TaxID=136370 RepID=A0A5M8PLY9_9LECA|nr:MAG: hypothetical protein FRX48_05923 [Lasallia pustulata]